MSHVRPFMSIVMITYNGEATIARAIESLLAQDYPKNRYEIIIIDDGSTDATADIAARYPVQYHRQPQNAGIANARTAGLRFAHGDVYVCFDDDCHVDTDWLSHLAHGYDTDAPLGVSGTLISDGDDGSLTERYISASNIEPAERAHASRLARFPVLARLAEYVMSNFRNPNHIAEAALPKVRVEELFGANSSYDMRVLKSVGGWDDHFSGIEDRALGKVITAQYPNRSLYSVAAARIYHRPDMTLAQYLLRPFKRGIYNARFHQHYHIFPPLFPFPFVYLALVLAALIINPGLGLFVALGAPLVLYVWWVRYAILSRSVTPLLFPYIQMIEETMVILGLLRGAIIIARTRYAHN